MTEQHDYFSAAAALAQATTLDVPELELMYRLEMSGDDFYQALADRVGNDDAAELLRRNGREEAGHAKRIQRALSIKLGREWQPSPETAAPLTIPLPDAIGPELFPVIVQAEIDGDAGYQRWAELEPDPEVARLLRLNGREETIHAERADQALAILQAAPVV